MISTPPALSQRASASLPSARIVSKSPAPSESAPWIDEDADRREGDAPAERTAASAIDGEAVEQGLGGERLVVAGQPVLDRADDGQRADAEEQAGGEERLRDRRVAPLRATPAWRRSPSRCEPVLDAERLADEPAEQHAAQHVEQVRVAPGAARGRCR